MNKEYVIGWIKLAGVNRQKEWYVAVEEDMKNKNYNGGSVDDGYYYRGIRTKYLHKDGGLCNNCGQEGFFKSKELAEKALERYKVKDGIELMKDDMFVV